MASPYSPALSDAKLKTWSMFRGVLFKKLSTAIHFCVRSSVYNAHLTASELNSAQSVILVFFYALHSCDVKLCSVLQKLFTSVEQLKSPYLVSWLRDDFNFSVTEVVRVLSNLAHLIRKEHYIVPDYIIQILVGLKKKYDVIEVCKALNDSETVSFLMATSTTVSKSQQTSQIIPSIEQKKDLKMEPDYAQSNYNSSFFNRPVSSSDFSQGRVEFKNQSHPTIEPKKDLGMKLDCIQNNPNFSFFERPGSSDARKNRVDLKNQSHGLRTREKSRPIGKRTGEAFKKPQLTHAISTPNISEKSSNELKLTSEESLIHSYLSKWGHVEPIDLKKFVCKRDKKGGTYPLHRAARDGMLAVIRGLINLGAPVNCRDDNGLTPAHYAAQAGRIDILEVLKSHGADLGFIGDSGSTLLHLAAWNNHAGTCGWLIQNGAEINAQGYKGRTALHRAAMWGHIETVRLLLSHGASTSITDNYKHTAYDMALSQGHVIVAEALQRPILF